MIRPTFVALLVTLFLPPAIYVALAASSMSTGLLVGVILWILVGLATEARPYTFRWSDARSLVLILTLIAVMFLHVVIESTRIPGVNFSRFFSSCLVLLVICIGADFASRNLLREPGAELIRAADLILAFICVLGLASLVGVPPIGPQSSTKAIVIFAEPSHFGLALLPLLLFRASVATKSGQIRLLAGALVLGALLQSLTTIAGVALLAAILLRPVYFIAIFALTAGAAATLDLTYYADRLNFSSDTTNLSTLVYLQGWQNATLNFAETDGIGVGFQQFGVAGSIGEISEKIAQLLGGDYLSLLDGGSTSTKLIAEFGVFGIIALLLFGAFALRAFRYLRKAQRRPVEERDVHRMFFYSLGISYSLELLIRGVGYFSPGGFLALVALISLRRLARSAARSGSSSPRQTAGPAGRAWSAGR